MSGQKKICPSCGGSGQIQFFQGESRFLLTVEECPECCGTGYLLLENDPDPKSKPNTPAQRRQVK